MALLSLQLRYVEHGRGLGLKEAAGQECGGARVRLHIAPLSGADHEVVLLPQRGELTFGIDNELLHLAGELLKESTQRATFAAPAVGCNQHARNDEPRQI